MQGIFLIHPCERGRCSVNMYQRNGGDFLEHLWFVLGTLDAHVYR